MGKNILPDRPNNDEKFMRLAIEEALLASNEGEVPVGAVIEFNGEVFATGRNKRISKNSAIAHAEIEAIEAATKKLHDWRLQDMTLYVTTEPCIMCAGAIIHSRIKRVVYGCKEPKMGAVTSIVSIFDNEKLHHKTNVTGGVLEKECSSILSSFFENLRK
jgi:tRNA(adenine34) deaminase